MVYFLQDGHMAPLVTHYGLPPNREAYIIDAGPPTPVPVEVVLAIMQKHIAPENLSVKVWFTRSSGRTR